jgi:hypothetical protein
MRLVIENDMTPDNAVESTAGDMAAKTGVSAVSYTKFEPKEISFTITCTFELAP